MLNKHNRDSARFTSQEDWAFKDGSCSCLRFHQNEIRGPTKRGIKRWLEALALEAEEFHQEVLALEVEEYQHINQRSKGVPASEVEEYHQEELVLEVEGCQHIIQLSKVVQASAAEEFRQRRL
jgi:hypothetical protein